MDRAEIISVLTNLLDERSEHFIEVQRVADRTRRPWGHLVSLVTKPPRTPLGGTLYGAPTPFHATPAVCNPP